MATFHSNPKVVPASVWRLLWVVAAAASVALLVSACDRAADESPADSTKTAATAPATQPAARPAGPAAPIAPSTEPGPSPPVAKFEPVEPVLPAAPAEPPAPSEPMTVYQRWSRDPQARPTPKPAAWRQGVLPTGAIFAYSGQFVDLPPYITATAIARTGPWSGPAALVADPAFRISRKGASYSVWARLEQVELSMPADEIVCLPVAMDVTIDQVRAAHGPPDHVGSFRHESDAATTQPAKISGAYWYGPICILAGESGKITAIAGWPSCL